MNSQSNQGVTSTPAKRGRGRPRKYPANLDQPKIKRGRGRPRKYPVLEKQRNREGEIVQALVKKVDSAYLMDKMLGYFTKLLILHSRLGKEAGKLEPVFERLKGLDMQMIEICKTVLNTQNNDEVA